MSHLLRKPWLLGCLLQYLQSPNEHSINSGKFGQLIVVNSVLFLNDGTHTINATLRGKNSEIPFRELKGSLIQFNTSYFTQTLPISIEIQDALILSQEGCDVFGNPRNLMNLPEVTRFMSRMRDTLSGSQDLVENLISLSGSQEDCPVAIEECIIPEDQQMNSQDENQWATASTPSTDPPNTRNIENLTTPITHKRASQQTPLPQSQETIYDKQLAAEISTIESDSESSQDLKDLHSQVTSQPRSPQYPPQTLGNLNDSQEDSQSPITSQQSKKESKRAKSRSRSPFLDRSPLTQQESESPPRQLLGHLKTSQQVPTERENENSPSNEAQNDDDEEILCFLTDSEESEDEMNIDSPLSEKEIPEVDESIGERTESESFIPLQSSPEKTKNFDNSLADAPPLFIADVTMKDSSSPIIEIEKQGESVDNVIESEITRTAAIISVGVPNAPISSEIQNLVPPEPHIDISNRPRAYRGRRGKSFAPSSNPRPSTSRPQKSLPIGKTKRNGVTRTRSLSRSQSSDSQQDSAPPIIGITRTRAQLELEENEPRNFLVKPRYKAWLLALSSMPAIQQ